VVLALVVCCLLTILYLKKLGVGLKVADCVSLFSLDKIGCVPGICRCLFFQFCAQRIVVVDTHVWQIAQSKYKARVDTNGGKSLTPSIYRKVSSGLSLLWGDNAGWAHQYVFNDKIKTVNKRSSSKRTKIGD
jgi:hypothetical protein